MTKWWRSIRKPWECDNLLNIRENSKGKGAQNKHNGLKG